MEIAQELQATEETKASEAQGNRSQRKKEEQKQMKTESQKL